MSAYRSVAVRNAMSAVSSGASPSASRQAEATAVLKQAEHWNDAVVLRTGCKLNLFLQVCGLRPDGYHELQTLFYPLAEPHDEIFLLPAQKPGLNLVCPQLPTLATETTTLHKALAAFNLASGTDFGFEMLLNKRVPAGAGLGGGSANAAGLLRFLNQEAGGQALSAEKLLEVAAGVGADVPFFLLDGPAVASGIGERLTPVQVSLSGYYLLLALPDVHVSTPWAYKEWDKIHPDGKPSQSALAALFGDFLHQKIRNCCGGLALEVWPWFYNNLEAAVFRGYPEIGAVKESLLKAGAKAALMSGSGSSVFGLFDCKSRAESAARMLWSAGCRTLLQLL